MFLAQASPQEMYNFFGTEDFLELPPADTYAVQKKLMDHNAKASIAEGLYLAIVRCEELDIDMPQEKAIKIHDFFKGLWNNFSEDHEDRLEEAEKYFSNPQNHNAYRLKQKYNLFAWKLVEI